MHYGQSRVSLRFGHAMALTVHWTVIHYHSAATLRLSLQFRLKVFGATFFQKGSKKSSTQTKFHPLARARVGK